jgi:hypothetical protein
MWGSNARGRRRPLTRLAAMLGRTRIALLAGILTVGIAGCGGNDGTIPQSQSEQLLQQLALLKNQVETSDCTLAEGTATKINEAIANLPDSVDPEVQDALSKGAENLTELAKDPSQCTGGATGASGLETTDTTDSTTDSTTDTDATTESTSTTTTTSTTDTSTPEQNTPEQPTGPGNQDETPTPPDGGNGGAGGPRSGGVVPPGGGKR